MAPTVANSNNFETKTVTPPASKTVETVREMWGDGDVRRRPLFGDTFAMRTDYTSGTFYRGRMQYLQNSPEDNALEPPPIFKTKRQAKNALKEKQIIIQKLSFPKKDAEGESVQVKSISKKVADGNKKQVQKKQNQQQQAVVYLPAKHDIRREDWEEIHQAGCRMWINHITGEAVHECPWERESSPNKLSLGSEHRNTENANDSRSDADSDNFNGTGSLVYDHDELNNLLEYFDKIRK